LLLVGGCFVVGCWLMIMLIAVFVNRNLGLVSCSVKKR
jgi:hypothetical protein